MKNSIEIQVAPAIDSYELIDSGNKMKLENVGGVLIVRTEPRAWWKPNLSEEWKGAQAIYEKESLKKWNFKKGFKGEDFNISLSGLMVKIKFIKSSKQIGIFPDQVPQWKWIESKIKDANREINVLNLFGYTGVASLIAARAGAKVTHVDASKLSIEWAKENQEVSGLKDKPIRWILDDAIAFMKREVKRGNKYDAIIMDPPTFGRGVKGEVWKVETELTNLIELCKEVLTPRPLFFIINMYATELSSISLGNILEGAMNKFEGNVNIGEFALKEKSSDRLLPTSIYASWSK